MIMKEKKIDLNKIKGVFGKFPIKLTYSLVFLIIVVFEGLVYSQIIPFGQVPDEITHYRFMFEETGTVSFFEELRTVVWEDGQFYSIAGHSDVKVEDDQYDEVKTAYFNSKLSLSSLKINIKVLRHLPAILGFFLGVILHLPIIGCTFMAELFSLIFFAIMGYIILKIVPVKKDIFMFCMLLPMSLQQGISVNYDAVLNPCCIFLFAYILKLYYQEEKVRWRDLFLILGVLIPIVVTKAPYTLIIFSIFIIPLSKYDLKIKNIDCIKILKKFWPVFVILCILGVVAFVYIGRRNTYVKTVIADVIQFKDTIDLFKRTFKMWGFYYIQQLIGMFGWLDATVSTIFIIFTLTIMTYLNCTTTEDFGEVKLSFVKRIILFIVGVALVLFIYIALQAWTYDYLDYDIYAGVDKYKEFISQIDFILGVQGRYFIPCLPIILVSVSGEAIRKNKVSYYVIQAMYYIVSFICIFGLLKARYWG